MQIRFLPNTRFEKWAMKFLLATLGLYVVALLLLAFALHKEGEMVSVEPVFTPFLAGAGILALLSGLSAFGTGLFSIIKEKERSILTFLAAFIGTLALIFVLGEFLIPH